MKFSTLLIVSKFSGRRSLSDTLIPHSVSMTETKSTSENESRTPARNNDEFVSGKLVLASFAAFDKNDITDSGNMILISFDRLSLRSGGYWPPVVRLKTKAELCNFQNSW